MGFDANSLAVSMVVVDKNKNWTQAHTNTLARVRFSYYDRDIDTPTNVDAVYCEDLYA